METFAKGTFKRRHYVLIQQAFADMYITHESPNDRRVIGLLAFKLADVFAVDSVKFDRVTFLKACGAL